MRPSCPIPVKAVPYKKRIKYSPKLSKKYTKNDLFISSVKWYMVKIRPDH
jgi:hypothetical protein